MNEHNLNPRTHRLSMAASESAIARSHLDTNGNLEAPAGQWQPGRVAEVPPKFARVGGSRPDFGPEKAKKHKKTLIKSKLKLN